ncbi:MAG: hypothetical protein EXX96DRAFT_81736 [Benjaminiella poitrasii]|nr:MAG: hypothetical protein EXX96DRAFT_81736 [Benjaminiella poitrasii]
MIPNAARKMSKSQRKQDTSFKHLQYLVSGLFRPLNILGHKLSLNVNNTHLQRYLPMLADCRLLLLNLSSQINQMRTNLAFHSINPSFSNTTSKSTSFFFLIR